LASITDDQGCGRQPVRSRHRLLEERKILDRAIEMQRTQGNVKTLESLRRVLKEDKLAERLVTQYPIADLDLLLLWNVGAVYPMLRTHTLLSALHSHMQSTPLVMFYPGQIRRLFAAPLQQAFGRSLLPRLPSRCLTTLTPESIRT
jgi:hypothetical protein